MDKTISTTQTQNDLFKLSYQVQHHTKALRSITTNNRGILVTGSLDGICAIFQKKENHYSHIANTQHHKDSPIYIVRSSIDDNFIFSGGKDAVINMMDCEGNLLKDFVGHTKIVNSISQAEPDCFISGSWDGTAIVWDIESSRNMFQLEGHSHAVTTLALKNKKFITASQDKAIRFWDADKLVRTVELAHEDIIRSIILDDETESFFTCSNDAVVKHWTMDGRLIGKLEEHEGFLFSICKKNGILFSGGDDKVVKYWRNSQVIGELYHPNTVWDLTLDTSGDLISACGDGAFRVFTKDSARWMNEKDLEEFNSMCLGAGQADEPGNANEINPDTLIPIADLQSTPGKEGEIKLFNDKGMGVAYVKKDGNWNLIGEVMQVKSTKKQYPGDKYFAEGEYDYIFDVELQGTYTKIPINKDDNCLVVAERFLTRENLHRNYLDDVTKFLRENVKSQNKLNEPKKPAAPKKKKLDVFNQYKFPRFEKNLYDSLELDKPFQKILEFNQFLSEDHQYSDNCLNEERTKVMEKMINKVKDKSQHDLATFEDDEIELFFFNVLKWPLAQLIPVLDLCRMFCLLKFMDKDYSNNYWKHQIYNRILECLQNGQQNHKILSLRILNNFFKGPRGCEMMESKLSELLPILATFKNETIKSLRSAIAGILMNYSSEIYIKNLEINAEFVNLSCEENDLKDNDPDENSVMNPNNSFEMERQVEHLKFALSPEENEYQQNNLNEEIKRSKIETNSKSNEKRIRTKENINYIRTDSNAEENLNLNEKQNLENKFNSNNKTNNNNKAAENISKKFKNKVNDLEQYIEKSKNKEIEKNKIDYSNKSRSKSKSKEYSNDKEKEKEHPPLSQKYKKTNMKAAFGKLLNEKNLISELRKNFLKSLTKLNDHDTKEIAFSELKDLINNYCTPEALRIYLNSLSTNYTTCTLAAKEIQAVLVGFIASVFQDNLLDSLDKPQSVLKTVARMCDILLNYLRKLYKHSMPKEDQNAIILIFIDPLLPLVSSGANKLCQLGGAIVLADLIVLFGKENKDILFKCHMKLINSLCKTKVENQFLVQALAELIRYLDIDYFTFYLKEIYERLINVLNNPKSNYCSRINSLECFKLIAKKLKNIDDEILGYHLTEIIFTLQNACKDRVHKVQLAANSTIRDWREIEEIFEKNKKKGKYDKQRNLSDKEANLFKIQNDNDYVPNNNCREEFDDEHKKNKEILANYKKGKMNKLNVLRNLSKLNKLDSNNNSNKMNTDEDDFFKQRRNNNRNINEFFKFDEIKEKNNFKKSADNFKEETYKKGIGNVLKLSNLLKNFQKENKNNILNDLRSKSNPRAANKISPPKNKLLESVANYLRISKSGEKNNNENFIENKNRHNNDFDLNKNRKYEKGFITDQNWYKKDKSPELNKQLNLSEEELLDYQFLSDGEFHEKNNYENFVFENEAEKNIENYENTKKQNKNNEETNLRPISKNKFNDFDYEKQKEVREKVGNENKDNKNFQSNNVVNVNKNLLAMKADINYLFFSFMHNLENFSNSMNTKLNYIESKIKKNKKIVKRLVKEKKSHKDSDKKQSKSKQDKEEEENSISKQKKNESLSKKEANKGDELDKKLETVPKKSSKQANNESNKLLENNANNNSSENSQKDFQKINKHEENKIKSDPSILSEQAALIEKLKSEVEFYKKNSQEIFKNINYTVVENANQKEHSSVKLWKEILELIERKEFNSAYSIVLKSEDDLFLLRLLCITGPVLNCLKLDICKKLIMRTNLIYRSHQIEFLLLDLIDNSHQHYIFNLLTKNEQNEILETLFQITGIKSVLGNIAADLYHNITTNLYR